MARFGRPPDPIGIAERRQEFEALKSRLGATASEIAAIAGISPHSVRRYQGPKARDAPTRRTLDAMRQELLRRLECKEAAASAAADNARQARIEYEREIA